MDLQHKICRLQTRGRKKKYKTQQQRKAARLATTRATSAHQIRSRYFRLVIPDLKQHIVHFRLITALKENILQRLLQQQKHIGLQYYKIAVETHSTTGALHLDILLLYKRSVKKSLNRFDYLIKHGNLTRYRRLNQAIINYGDKEDQQALTNLPKDVSNLLMAKQIQLDPYSVLKIQMLRDPFHFNVHRWLSDNNLDGAISKTNWSKAVLLLKKQQQIECNRIIRSKPGFKLITKQLIRQVLRPVERRAFIKHKAVYAKIIDKVNEIVTHGYNRPHKTKHLLVVAPPNTGKTSLALKLQEHTSVYYKGVHNWYPCYASNTYNMILWNQFSLRSMSYPQLLNFLEGTKIDLQYKGGSVLKTDNQLIYMTSNMSLTQHINSRFGSKQSRALAEVNLRARIEQIVLPPKLNLFVLQKLIISPSAS